MKAVLVHGAWHGAWVWDGVERELTPLGVEAVAVDLPFTGFDDDVAAARAAIEGAGSDLVVCGHSYGGLVISAAARGLPVRHLVYLAAFMEDEGQTPLGRWFDEPVALHGAVVPTEDGRLRVDPAQAAACFYGDATHEVAAEAVARLRTIPGDGGAGDRSAPAWWEIPSTYVVCTRDQALHPEVQRALARNASALVELESDHSPFLTQPTRVAEILVAAAQSGPPT